MCSLFSSSSPLLEGIVHTGRAHYYLTYDSPLKIAIAEAPFFTTVEARGPFKNENGTYSLFLHPKGLLL